MQRDFKRLQPLCQYAFIRCYSWGVFLHLYSSYIYYRWRDMHPHFFGKNLWLTAVVYFYSLWWKIRYDFSCSSPFSSWHVYIEGYLAPAQIACCGLLSSPAFHLSCGPYFGWHEDYEIEKTLQWIECVADNTSLKCSKKMMQQSRYPE